MAMLKNIPVHKGKKFTWTAGSFAGSTCASDLGSRVGGAVWDDSCDWGFIVQSERTGNKVLFTFDREIKDNEGEHIATIYKEHNCGSRVAPIVITVFND